MKADLPYDRFGPQLELVRRAFPERGIGAPALVPANRRCFSRVRAGRERSWSYCPTDRWSSAARPWVRRCIATAACGLQVGELRRVAVAVRDGRQSIVRVVSVGPNRLPIEGRADVAVRIVSPTRRAAHRVGTRRGIAGRRRAYSSASTSPFSATCSIGDGGRGGGGAIWGPIPAPNPMASAPKTRHRQR